MTDQIISQTKEIRQEISTILTKEAHNFMDMCNQLNEELTKSCRYSNQTCQQAKQQERSVRIPAPVNRRTSPTPVVPKSTTVKDVPPKVDQYIFQRKTLTEMGFTDAARIEELLQQTRGDIHECVNALFQ